MVEVTISLSKLVKLVHVDADFLETRSIPAQQPVTVLSESSAESLQSLALVRLEEAERAAADMVRRATEEAERLVNDAHLEADQLFAAERSRGRAEGLESGRQEALAAAADTCEALVGGARRVVQEANQHRQRFVSDLALPLAELVMASVRQLLHRELATASADVEEMVRQLIVYVTESSRVEVRVHPDDYGVATTAHPVWQSQKFGDWSVVVVPDAAITPGGCELRSDVGRVDARMETKLALLQESVATFMERRAAEFVHAMD